MGGVFISVTSTSTNKTNEFHVTHRDQTITKVKSPISSGLTGSTELDLQQHNLGLNSAWKRAQERSKWRQLVEMAMSSQGRATR